MTDLTPEQTDEVLIDAVRAVAPYGATGQLTASVIRRIADVVRAHDDMVRAGNELRNGAEPKPTDDVIHVRAMARRLGHLQIMALDMLNRRGPFPGGWTIDNTSSTVRILDSLVKNGFATAETSERAQQRGMIAKRYTITPAGRVALAVAIPKES